MKQSALRPRRLATSVPSSRSAMKASHSIADSMRAGVGIVKSSDEESPKLSEKLELIEWVLKCDPSMLAIVVRLSSL